MAASSPKRYVSKVKEHIKSLFGPHILKEAARQIDLAASMPGAEEVALFDRMGELIRGDDTQFDLIVFDTAPTGHTLRLIQMPELMEAWIRALSRSRQAMLGRRSGRLEGSDHAVVVGSARAAARVSRPAAESAHDGVRAGAGPRAASDRGDGARDRAARRRRRQPSAAWS